ncbi:hypothetical protein EVAR_90119_1 [Eumeta japonica]|uniref:Uncharacterized protein n=1 Tax=Eumeta variegata TaxID=151549 RepID=A0A4C2A2W1_EUMVA|nr:hypothetical protein EVAR_90119_1 [Eumeta japonica]
MRWLNLSTGIDYASQLPREAAVRSLYLALSAATELRNSITKIKPNTPPLRLPCSSAERSLNVYVYGTTVRSSHGSRRAAPKSDEYVLRSRRRLSVRMRRCGQRGVESVRAAALSGCGSVRLAHAGGRAPLPPLITTIILLAVGMLWEVTDLEVDKVVSTLLALCVPTSAPLPWESVGKAQWSNGVLDTNTEAKTPMQTERDLLRAVAKARRSTSFVMIASSGRARLPLRIQE